MPKPEKNTDMFFMFPKSRENHLIRWAKNLKIDFPSKPDDLDKVEKIDIKLKEVIKIPKEIDCLINLTEIHAEYNELSELPWEFGNLKKLKILNFSHNNFNDIPGVVCKLTNLEYLNMESNSIKKIATVIANLENLIELNLSFNIIADIPAEIGHLKHLVKLNLAANNISELNSSMHRLYSLSDLILWKNNITEIPDFIKELPNLKNIELETDIGKINQQLVVATINDDLLRVEKLVALGADVNFKWLNYGNLSFTTPLFEAHSVEIIKFLLDHGADTSIKRELPAKSSTIKVWESDKSSGQYETFLTKKHPLEVVKYLKSINILSR